MGFRLDRPQYLDARGQIEMMHVCNREFLWVAPEARMRPSPGGKAHVRHGGLSAGVRPDHSLDQAGYALERAVTRGLARKQATAMGPPPDAQAAPPEAHESLVSRATVAEVPLTGLSFRHFETPFQLSSTPSTAMPIGP